MILLRVDLIRLWQQIEWPMAPSANTEANRSSKPRSNAPYFSWAGFTEGLIAVLPLFPSQIAFGAVFGMLAAQKALATSEAIAMSGLMFAGLSQVAVMQVWPAQFTAASLAALMIVTFTINARFFLMSLTFRPWFGPLPAWQSYPMLALAVDPTWLKSMRYYSEGGRDIGYYLGGSAFMFVMWLLATWIGYEFTGLLANPYRFGIDLIIPAFFTSLLVLNWKGVRRAGPWMVAGLVAVSIQQLGFANWSIAGGSIAGAVAAGLRHE